MSTEASLIVSVLGWIVILSFFVGMALIVFGVIKPRELPRGIPIVMLPVAAWLALWKQAKKLRRSQRIAAFLQLANDLRMRKKRVDGLLPRRPAR